MSKNLSSPRRSTIMRRESVPMKFSWTLLNRHSMFDTRISSVSRCRNARTRLVPGSSLAAKAGTGQFFSLKRQNQMAATTGDDDRADGSNPSRGCLAGADHDREVPEIDLLSPLTIRGV